MEEIKVFGPMPGCIKCKKTLEIAEKVAGDLGITARKYDIFSEEAESLGILMSPTVVFGDKVLASGQMLPYERLRELVEESMKEKE
ncbi:MAG TPA: thioredoxin family protein [Candidatus Methanofastidiosa archaeon]|nr:thioredoxin family protein [Candidatus Methanofastidiosa archaeon]